MVETISLACIYKCSPSKMGGLYKYCVLFKPKNGNLKNAVLVTRPFVNLSKATGKDSVLQNHDKCQYHKDAMLLGSQFAENVTNPKESIQCKIYDLNERQYETNSHILQSIVKTILLCGKQNIPLRGHRDDSTSEAPNKGNFLAILNLLADSDDILKNHLENAKKNATYTSKTIQNDFIDVIGEYIRDKLTERIKQDGSVFTIIADETTDMSNQEVLALCLRFVQSQPNVEIKEVFFDFVHLRRTSGEKIADVIIE